MLNILYLVDAGLLDVPVLYLSRHILRHRDDYYRLLLDVTREGRWEPWIGYMLDAVYRTAVWTTDKINAVRALLEATAEHVRRHAPGIYSRELVELLFVQPYCRIGNLVDTGHAKRQTASKYLGALVAAGVLTEHKAGREKLFLNTRLQRLLTVDTNAFDPFPG